MARWPFAVESAPKSPDAVGSSLSSAWRTAASTSTTVAQGARRATRDHFDGRTEPGFAAAVSSVLENDATEVVVNIRSNRTHALDGNLGVELKKIGFDLGGMTQHSGSTSLHIRATFPQARKGWK
jgi:hypothetical protein